MFNIVTYIDNDSMLSTQGNFCSQITEITDKSKKIVELAHNFGDSENNDNNSISGADEITLESKDTEDGLTTNAFEYLWEGPWS